MIPGGWVYIMTNQPNGTLYVGVTSDLVRRVWQHREGVIEGFTQQYGLRRTQSFVAGHEVARALPLATRDAVDGRVKPGHDDTQNGTCNDGTRP